MKHPRDWSNRAWIIAGVLLLVLLVVVRLVPIAGPAATLRDAALKVAPLIAALIALASLVVAAVAARANWLRQKRQATLEAWNSWSDSTVTARQCLSRHLGSGTINQAQAVALVDHAATLKGDKGQDLTMSEKADVGNSMVSTLNGLERLAVGTRCGVYDEATLRSLGNTIIVRTYERFLPYIEERRATNLDVRQRRAYVDLDAMVASLRRYQNQLDQERLKRLGS